VLSSREFFRLMRKRAKEGPVRIDKLIDRHVDDYAVMMCDSSGFSRITAEHGILQFLSVMTVCYDGLIPLLESIEGECLSHNADNILAVFKKPAKAVEAAVAMHRWLAARNMGLADKDRFNVCIGIHMGSVVRLKKNVFGDVVNVAAKLGEDLAAKDEILITGPVARKVKGRFDIDYARTAEIGGRSFELHRVRY
jgi:class 3 adenylate cyclase